jgi:hypothetical protein
VLKNFVVAQGFFMPKALKAVVSDGAQKQLKGGNLKVDTNKT